MARTGFAKIYTKIWSDKDFIALPEALQRGFLMLMSQGNLNAAGVIALQPRRWARFAADSTSENITEIVHALEQRRYVYADWDTEELLVRSYIRNDELWKQPNVMKGSFDDIEATLSDRLKAVLRTELERIPWDTLTGKMADDTRARAAEVIASLPTMGEVEAASPKAPVEPFPEPFGEPFPEGFQEPSPEGSAEPSPGLFPEPKTEPPVVVAVAVEAEVGSSKGSIPNPSDSGAEAPTSAEPAEKPEEPKPATAQTIVGEWIDRCAKRPPKNVIGQMAKQIRQLLDEGIDPDDIRRGIAEWMTKQLHPSTLPSIVNDVMNRPSRHLHAVDDSRFQGGPRKPTPDHDQFNNGKIKVNL